MTAGNQAILSGIEARDAGTEAMSLAHNESDTPHSPFAASAQDRLPRTVSEQSSIETENAHHVPLQEEESKLASLI